MSRPPVSRGLDVCLASLRFHPVYAGPAIRFRRYAPGLKERGVNLRVFAADLGRDGAPPEEPEVPLGSLLEPDCVAGIPVQRVRLSSSGEQKWLFYRYDRSLAEYCRRRGQEPDVVHLLNLNAWSARWYRRIRRARVPLVYTATMMPNADLAWYKRRFDRIAYRRLDCVVVSTGVMRDAMGSSRSGPRLEVIPNGLDVERFKPLGRGEDRWALRDRLGLDPSSELVLFIGGVLNHRKGIDVLAQAWIRVAASRPAAKLLLVGPHVDELRPRGPQSAFLEGVRRSLSEAPGGLDRVTLTGPVDRVEDYMRAADVFVFPSRKEGMPNVVPEAFGCGLASVLTPFEGLPAEFGRPGEQYQLTERTPGDLAEAITGLLDSPARREALARAARTWVEQHLNVEDSLDRYADLYRELTERARITGG